MKTTPNFLTPVRRQAVDQLLVQYLELPEAQQADYLATCRARYRRLSQWLDQLVDAGHTVTLLDDSVRQVAGDAVQSRSDSEQRTELAPGTEIGPWRILGEAGQGGMGLVYRGERADGAFEMGVAIKLIGQRKRGLARLLQRECRLLAKLDHPSITRLVDAGLDDMAGPFLVMEWVEGEDLDQHLDRRQPSLGTRLRLFEQLADATTHAHQRLVIHGDIKPGNVRIRADGTAKLMDFGVARLLQADEINDASVRALTPSFAAPEQLRGEEITPLSDIWSLGAMLYWLLTGTTLSRDQHVDEASLFPSGHARGRELAAIIRKACAEQPSDRYSSVEELRNELDRLQNGFPVTAMPPSRGYRFRRFLGRHRLGVGIGVLFGLVVITGASGMLWQAEQTHREAQRAMAAAERSDAIKDFLVEMLSEADPNLTPGEPPTVRDVLRRSETQVRERFAAQPDIAYELLSVIGAAHFGLGDRNSAQASFREVLHVLRSEDPAIDDPLALPRTKYMLAIAMEDSAERRELLESARSTLALHDEGDALLEAGILSMLAHSEFMKDEHARTVELARQAEELACSEESLAEDATFCMSVLNSLYFYLTRSGQREQALAAASRGYDMAVAEYGGQAHPRLVSNGIGLANALIDNRRPDEAIDLLGELIEITRTYGDQHSTVETHLYFPLARAHSALGADHLAVEKWSRALDLMLERQPDGLGIPVQLNFLVGRLLNLGQTEAAQLAYRNYFPVTWDNTPHHAIWSRRLNELRMAQLERLENGEGVSDERWWQALTNFQEHYDYAVPKLMMLALGAALDRGEPEAAQAWKQAIVEAAPQFDRPGQWKTLKARYHLLAGDIDRASEWTNRASRAFEGHGEVTGPRLSALQAIKAEIHCRRGEPTIGLQKLQAARAYWIDEADIEHGARMVADLAPSCPNAAAE